MRVALLSTFSLALLSFFAGCNDKRTPTGGSGATPTTTDVECEQTRVELGGNPERLRTQRRTFRERVTARFGAPAFDALRTDYGGRCDDDADFRCTLEEIGPFAHVQCLSPVRHVPEQLYADGPKLRRVEGLDAFELGLRSAQPAPTELDPILTYFQRVTRAVVLRDKRQVVTTVPAADAESMTPSTSALIPPTLIDGNARFVAYEDQGYQAPRTLIEVRVDLVHRTSNIHRISLKPRPYPTAVAAPPQRATLGSARYNGTEGAVCAWGEYRGDRSGLPPPAACGNGMRCCSGGAAGSDGNCVRTGGADCPRLP